MSPDPGVGKAGLCQAGGEGWIPAFPGRTKKAGIKGRRQERDGTVSNLAPCRLFQQSLGNPPDAGEGCGSCPSGTTTPRLPLLAS